MKRIENYILRFFSMVDGVAAIEMAFIFPVLLLIYLSVFEITMLYTFSKRLTRVSSYIGDIVAQETLVSKQYFQGFKKFSDATMYPYVNNDCSINISGYWIDKNKKSLEKWHWSSGTVNNKQNLDIPYSIKDYSTFIVRAEVSMTYHPIILSIILPKNLDNIVFDKVFYYRQRLGDEVVCKDC
ncbi:TadE/TadG family type IV pilus assembly protein [Candidatus Liberibacter brunswickensis]|uniref:TadE/TadG family type IV pilus assembly protein n=1 Tax=Candidatus Liberibacter brunswickensis TaxID=1968796 RepID=UPI002FE06212